jgi:tetratricopeptide (TPR) repeat protein
MPRAQRNLAWVLYSLITGGALLLYLTDPAAYVRFTYEDRLGEWLQTWLFAALFLLTVMVARREPAYRWFCLLLSVAALYTVMEEISWGQRLFDFESPVFFAEQNVQGETNLHNLLTGPVNTGLKVFIEIALAAALIGYGLIYPLLLQLGRLPATWLNRLGILPPPLYLWPFFVTAALFELGWFKINEAEIAELLVGAGLVLTLMHYRLAGVSSRRSGYLYIASFIGLVVLAWLTATWFYSLPGRAEQVDARLANGYEKFAERFEQNDDYLQAAELYRSGFELGPRYLPMLHEALRNYQKAGATQAYDHWYRVMLDATAEQVMTSDPNVEKLLMLAKEYAGIGANTQAESFSAQALTVAVTRVNDAPTDADGYYWLGRVYQARDEIETARRAYEQALAIDPQRSRYILALRSLGK